MSMLKVNDRGRIAERRSRAAYEFVTSERSYYKGLNTAVCTYVLRLKTMLNLGRPLMTLDEIQDSFLNVEEIKELSKNFLDDLELIHEQGVDSLVSGIGPLVNQFIPYFKLYTHYVNHYNTAWQQLDKLRRTSRSLDEFIELQERCEGKTIADLLITPVQRIPRYLLLLESLIMSCEVDDPSVQPLEHAYSQMKTVASEMNSSFHESEARMRVVYIQQTIFNDKVQLVDRHRLYVRHGALKKKWNNSSFRYKDHKKYLFMLFNDILLYASRPSRTSEVCTLKHIIPLQSIDVIDIFDDAKQMNAWLIQRLDNDIKSFTVYAPTNEEKQIWMNDLIHYSSAAKRAAAIGSIPRITQEQLERKINFQSLGASVPDQTNSDTSDSISFASTTFGTASNSVFFSNTENVVSKSLSAHTKLNSLDSNNTKHQTNDENIQSLLPHQNNQPVSPAQENMLQQKHINVEPQKYRPSPPPSPAPTSRSRTREVIDAPSTRAPFVAKPLSPNSNNFVVSDSTSSSTIQHQKQHTQKNLLKSSWQQNDRSKANFQLISDKQKSTQNVKTPRSNVQLKIAAWQKAFTVQRDVAAPQSAQWHPIQNTLQHNLLQSELEHFRRQQQQPQAQEMMQEKVAEILPSSRERRARWHTKKQESFVFGDDAKTLSERSEVVANVGLNRRLEQR